MCRWMHGILGCAVIEMIVDAECTYADSRLGCWSPVRVFGVPEYMLISLLYSTFNMASTSAKPLQNIYYERVSHTALTAHCE